MKRYTALLLAGLMLVCTACAAPAQPTEPAPEKKLQSMTVEQVLGDMTITNTSEYHYDDRGFVTEIVNSTDGQETSRTTVTCDDHGNPTRQTTVTGEMTVLVVSEMTYDAEGNLLTKIDTNSTNGVVTDVREYHYNARGDHTFVQFTKDGAVTQTNTYEYNDQGQCVAMVMELGADSYRTETEFDENGRSRRAVQKDAQGTVKNTTEYAYDADGSQTQIQYDAAGTVLYTMKTVEREEGDTRITETYMNDVLTTRVTAVYGALPTA